MNIIKKAYMVIYDNIIGKWEYTNKNGEKLIIDIKSANSKQGRKLYFVLSGMDIENTYNSKKHAAEFDNELGWWFDFEMQEFIKELNNTLDDFWGEKFINFKKVK